MKVLLFGGRGFMGRKFLSVYPDAVAPSVDIGDITAVSRVLDAEQPDIVINAAGKTGVPNVDWCEDHKLETIHSNVTGPFVLLEECGKRGIYWVHLSSGCIYSGDNGGKGFSEDDAPNFAGSFYSRTKAWSEAVLREFPAAGPDGTGGVLILRLRMPFDKDPHSRNLLNKLKAYTHILDAQNSITYLPDFLDATQQLIEKRKTGIYNMVNAGSISPYRIMELYREIVDPKHTFQRLELKDLPGKVKAGRSTCVLSTKKLEQEGIPVRPVEVAVREALQALKSQN